MRLLATSVLALGLTAGTAHAGVAETVDCGSGTGDDPEPSGTDTFVNCELI